MLLLDSLEDLGKEIASISRLSCFSLSWISIFFLNENSEGNLLTYMEKNLKKT